jgi:hypothetical protein
MQVPAQAFRVLWASRWAKNTRAKLDLSSSAETTALVAFLEALASAKSTARNISQAAAPGAGEVPPR